MEGTNHITFCEAQMKEIIEYYLHQILFKNDIEAKVETIKFLANENVYHVKISQEKK